jgi:hypothetical protein
MEEEPTMKIAHTTKALLLASAFGIAPALAEPLIPDQPMMIDGVETVCTGTSLANRTAPEWRAYTLRIEFVGKGGQYLGNEQIRVSGNGVDVSVQCKGPWMAMKLPSGSYHVAADVEDAGHMAMNVRVAARALRVVTMRFPNAGGEVSKPFNPRVASR